MKLKIDEKNENIRLDKLLSTTFDISRNKISKIDIYVNTKLTKVSYKTKVGDIIEFEMPDNDTHIELEAKDIDFEIVYEDEYLAIINKPYNLVVHPSITYKQDTLVSGLLSKFDKLSNIDKARPGIVHRLDKDTSGLIIIAKDNETHIKLQEMFKKHEIHKTYLAILKGKIKNNLTRVESYIGRDKNDRKKMSSNTNSGKLAISKFARIVSNDKYSLVKVNILTGRTHQIRVQAKEMGYNVVGDKVYSKKEKVARQQLHSYMLEFIHPMTGKDIKVKADMPDDMLENIKKFGLEVDDAGI
ncbi:RluA family pseudouridine synthase [Oceanivirga salmonicida]|uniref:RluA family pseudouridine synthase n=1 Tax=Oceanivirga salmonicida TaxID=1769291 RepID=UPI0012E2AE10|nr:RluA family pseudouridine synthase [Oceanivirga salmonicida]